MRENGRVLAVLTAVAIVLCFAAWAVYFPGESGDSLAAQQSEAAESHAPAAQLPADSVDVDAPPQREAAPPESSEQGAVRVQVLDPNGQAVPDVVVAVGMRIPGQNSAIRLASGRTGDDGRVALQLDHARRERVAAFPPNPELMLDAKLASTERVRVKKLMFEAEAEETVLTVPAVRRLELEVIHADGSPVEVPVEVSATWAPTGTPSDSRVWSQRRAETLPLQDGVATLVCGLDMDLRVWVTDQSEIFVHGYEQLAGPTAADPPVVQRTIALGERVARVVGRLLDESGQPHANARVSLYQTLTLRPTADYPAGEPESRWSYNFDCDAEGRFDLPLPINDYLRLRDRSWTLVLTSRDPGISLPRLDEVGAHQVRFDVPSDAGPGAIHDVGEQVLVELQWPLLVAGRALDADGSRATAVIHVTTTEKNWQKRKRLWQGRPERDGSFAVFAEPPANGEVLVSIGGFGNLGQEQIVPVGSTDLLFEMVEGITLHGRLILSDGLPWTEMSVHMPGGRSKEIFPGGSLAVDYLRPSADSWVSLEHNGRELWRSAPLVIDAGAGQDFRPVQVQNVDLRGQHRVWEFQVLDPDGKPFPKNTHTAALSATEHNTVYLDEASMWRQVFPIDVQRIGLRSSGYETVELSWPPPSSVTLRKSVR